MNHNNTTNSDPPSHALSEYITIGYQAVFLCVGVPLNIYALISLISIMRRASGTPRFVLLKFHLVVSDLMILLIYTVSEISWMITFSWHGGLFLCKLVKFFHVFAFVLHSNIIVSVAVDRIFAIRSLKDIQSGRSQHSRVRMMLVISWLSAMIVSIPQIFVWTVDSPYAGWTQCATIWEFQEFFTAEKADRLEAVYNVGHLLVVFYFPAVFLLVAYLFTFIKLRRCLKEQQRKGLKRPCRSQIEMEFVTETHFVDTQIHGNGAESPMITVAVRNSVAPARPSSSSRISNVSRLTSSKTLRQTVVLALAYVICFAPYNVCSLWRQIAIEDWREGNYDLFIAFLEGLIILNAVIDPILYKLASM